MPEDLNRHIGRLKDQWRQEFRDTRVEITKLQSRLNELRQKLNNADEILAAARTAAHGKRIGTKYANTGVTEAVRSFFSEHPFTEHSITAVMRRLQDEGLKSDAQNLRDIISITCRRLWKADDFLISDLRNGTRVFRLKDKAALLKKEQAGAGKPTPAVQSISNQ